IVLVAVLSGIALVNFSRFSTNAYNQTAQSDYRNLLVAYTDAFTRPDAPLRYVVRRETGPGSLPSPLDAMRVSPEVEVTVVYTKRLRQNQPPRITSTIEVRHLEGTKMYRRVEANGVVTEQIVDL
ncbi:MAG: hypothetical protein KDD55_13980, partial [Bdellovibrionales bacterium]|nr:hypothetical protein [Bdellovibrionales bacterium]